MDPTSAVLHPLLWPSVLQPDAQDKVAAELDLLGLLVKPPKHGPANGVTKPLTLQAPANGAVPSATNGAIPAATNGAVPATTNGAVPSATNGTIPAATNGVDSATTKPSLQSDLTNCVSPKPPELAPPVDSVTPAATPAVVPAVTPRRQLQLDDLKRLPFLLACIKESMRMYPVVSVMGR